MSRIEADSSAARRRKRVTAEKLQRLTQHLNQTLGRNGNRTSKTLGKNKKVGLDIDACSFALELFSKASSDFLEQASLDQLTEISLRTEQCLSSHLKSDDKVSVKVLSTTPKTAICVVLADRPFIVNTVSEAVRHAGADIQVLLHPIISRNEQKISLSYVELGSISAEILKTLVKDLDSALHDLILMTEDFTSMLMHCDRMAQSVEAIPPNSKLSALDTRELAELLRWLIDGALVFCGYSSRTIDRHGNLSKKFDTRLGILRPSCTLSGQLETESLSEAELLLRAQSPVHIMKTAVRSRVHRRSRLLSISLLEVNSQGTPIAVHSLIGLTTSKARAQESSSAPFIRRKLQRLVETEALSVNTYDYKSIINLIDNMPIDDALRLELDELRELTHKVINSYSKNSTQVSLFLEPSHKGVSVFVNIPRDRFSSRLRTLLQTQLEKRFHAAPGSSEYHIDVSDKFFIRFYFSVLITSSLDLEIDQQSLEKDIAQISRSWRDNFDDQIRNSRSLSDATSILHKYGEAFADDYQALHSAAECEHDIASIERLTEAMPFFVSMFDTPELALNVPPKEHSSLIVYHLGSEISISRALPILENAGLEVMNEKTSRCLPIGTAPVFIHRFSVKNRNGIAIDAKKFNQSTALGLRDVLLGIAANDPLNQLLLNSDFDIRAISLLRAYSSLLSQLNKFATRHSIFSVLASNSELATLLWKMFDSRFNPKLPLSRPARMRQFEALSNNFYDGLHLVTDLSQDRILRGLGNLVSHTLRTNFYRYGSAIALKIHSAKAEVIPQPKPLYEIFVSSPLVEGVHLRASKVARGGLRWSDRRDDYRTEVLGLMKTQKIKNTVIVPSGAKGGFIVRQLPEDPKLTKAVVETAYTEFIRALLSLADNRVGNEVKHPEGLIIYDGEDPYFVVAADKGTATFSDIANRVATQEYDFWLGDAFASGGSNGYDHKLYGITAKGAWESVKRHFNALGLDYKNVPFSVVGIGDMSGDVFGNGLIFSDKIKLLGAFNHQHIFVDPTPNPERSFSERLRLFQTPGTQWSDYNPKLISKGGGVFNRLAKEIKISPEIRTALSISDEMPDVLSGEQLIIQILKAPVDLLWNGGIGTYFKADVEANPEVNDSANDRVRINASELRARVIGEGGNLGFTQKARIEYARRGGKIFTDAIDNSGGVDLSDHEVNLKILFAQLMKSGKVSLAERNKLLKSMAPFVVEDVLADNRGHAVGLTLSALRSARNVDYHRSLIREVCSRGYLQRALECLPDEEELNQRVKNKTGLYTPELAVILAGVKMWLKESFLGSKLTADKLLLSYLYDYFPEILRKRFGNEIAAHPLAEHIVATRAINFLINSAGISFVHRMCMNHSVSPEVVLSCFLAAEMLLDTRGIQNELRRFDSEKDNTLFLSLLEEVSRALRATTSWLISNRAQFPVDETSIGQMLSRYQNSYRTVRDHASQLLIGGEKALLEKRLTSLSSLKLSNEVTNSIALFPLIIPVLEMLETAQVAKKDVREVALTFSHVLSTLGANQLITMGNPYESSNRWEKELRIHAYGEIRRSLSAITVKLLKRNIHQQVQVQEQLRQSPSFEPLRQLLSEYLTQSSSVAALAIVGKQLHRFEL